MRGCHEIGDFGANVLNQNNGEGTFSDITRQARVQWFEVRLEGVESNRDGLGARVAPLSPLRGGAPTASSLAKRARGDLERRASRRTDHSA